MRNRMRKEGSEKKEEKILNRTNQNEHKLCNTFS